MTNVRAERLRIREYCGGRWLDMEKDGLLRKPTAYIMFFVTGGLFAFCCLTGKKLAAEGNIVWTGGYLFRTLLLSLLVGGLAGDILCFGMYRSAVRVKKQRREAFRWQNCPKGAVFGGSFALLLAGWLPGFLAYYPAICTYDSPIQAGQIAENSFIDHHPLAHTLLIKGAMDFGKSVLGNVNAGIAAYALLQLFMLAAVFALGILWLYGRGTRPLWLVVFLLLLMIFPFNVYMGLSVTKDTIFSAFFVLQILVLYELLYQAPPQKRVTGREVLFFFSTLGMILFRNNGKYAFLVLLAVLVLAVLFGGKSRKASGRLLLWSVAGFVAGNIALTALFWVTDAQQGDRREMLSMPIQQLARCMIYHGGVGVLPEDDNTMDEVDKALIRDFILDEGYREYDPVISDPVKRHTNTYVVRYRPKDFLSTYFRLLTRYPGDFINAALAVNAGYLYPGDVTHARVNMTQGVSGMGYVQTRWNEEVFANYGIYKDSRWEWLHGHMERWADENGYLKIPVLKYLFMPGIWMWLYLVLAGGLVIKRKFRRCLPLALVLGYYVTLLLGPAVQLRYIYPVMAAFPFAALMSILDRDTGERL